MGPERPRRRRRCRRTARPGGGHPLPHPRLRRGHGGDEDAAALPRLPQLRPLRRRRHRRRSVSRVRRRRRLQHARRGHRQRRQRADPALDPRDPARSVPDDEGGAPPALGLPRRRRGRRRGGRLQRLRRYRRPPLAHDRRRRPQRRDGPRFPRALPPRPARHRCRRPPRVVPLAGRGRSPAALCAALGADPRPERPRGALAARARRLQQPAPRRVAPDGEHQRLRRSAHRRHR